jgi:hypothetical protein
MCTDCWQITRTVATDLDLITWYQQGHHRTLASMGGWAAGGR